MLSQALKLAQWKRLLSHIPHNERFQERKARQGFFEHEEFERLVSHLPDYLADFVTLAYWSGWRKGEIAALEWRDIQGNVIRLRPEVSKTHEGRLLTLNRELQDLIARRRETRHQLVPLVFHREGYPVYEFRKSWRTACKAAGCEGKLFHDLRRAAVRNMVFVDA